ncbi:hypothetical protein ACHAWC_007707 [Mediolabrus comicus]
MSVVAPSRRGLLLINIKMVTIALLLFFGIFHFTTAFSPTQPPPSSSFRQHNRPLSFATISTADAWSRSKSKAPSSTSSSTSLQMVFDVPSAQLDNIETSLSQRSASAGTQQIIDNILDECTRFSARRPIMVQFDPESRSIWRHWRGTVLAETWKSAAKHAVWGIMVYMLLRKYSHIQGWLHGFERVWGELLAVTTFTLTFFVNEAYSCWRKCLDTCYIVQGRLNDLSMALAGYARRVEPPSTMDPQSPDTTSSYTEPSKKVLIIIARYIRLFNILSYASFTRSHRPLLTPQGMRRMVKRGLITEKERILLTTSKVSATSRHNVILMWLFRTAIDARKAGHFEGGFGFEQNILLRVEEIRAEANYMECILRGRMPFSYAHIVQILVDSVTGLYPVMAFSSGLSFQIGVLGSIFLTMTYQGLFDLAKRFLDPFHNESFWSGFDPIRVDTLIAETNSGSLRWMEGLEDMPIPLRSIQEGGSNLDLFVLPDEGISVEEVAQMEASEETGKTSKLVASDSSSSSIQNIDYPQMLITKGDTVEDEQQTYQE